MIAALISIVLIQYLAVRERRREPNQSPLEMSAEDSSCSGDAKNAESVLVRGIGSDRKHMSEGSDYTQAV